jgi:hypothetical protein
MPRSGADVRHHVDAFGVHGRDQGVAHHSVAHQMGEIVDARRCQLDRVLMVEHMRRDLEAEPVALVDDGAG